MLQSDDALQTLRGRVSALILRYLNGPQLLWLLAWCTDARASMRMDGGYLRDLAAKSSCWTEDSLQLRLQTGRALLFRDGGCLWDSSGELLGLGAADALTRIDARLVTMVENARDEKKTVLHGMFGFGMIHVSRMIDGDVLLVLD